MTRLALADRPAVGAHAPTAVVGGGPAAPDFGPGLVPAVAFGPDGLLAAAAGNPVVAWDLR